MPWTEITRPYYRRDGLRYASDMTDAEWALIARLLRPPIGAAARSGFVRGGAGHLFTFCPLAASGAPLRKEFPSTRPSRAIFTRGVIPRGKRSSRLWYGGPAAWAQAKADGGGH